MKNENTRRLKSFLGYTIFFITIAAVVMIAVVIYDRINVKTQGDRFTISITMFVVIVFLALACTVVDAIRRKIMVDRPAKRILEATQKIASGDFSVRINTYHPYGKYDEYDLIIENLNEMAKELSKNKVLKTDFISNVSHELKTPLAVIQNYATALKNCNEDKQTQKKYVETILQASKNLSALVTNVLSLNKLENQSVKLELQKFNLTEGLAQAVLNYEDAMEKKGIELNCNFDDVTIYSAPNYLEIIFNNLISNAVKFTSKGGKITVNLKRENDKAVVQVKDNGCGISVESGARIFEKFYQCDTAHSQKGNGLGLALVKKVIDVLGGEISVNSTLGEGSTFTVTLKGVINE